MTHQQNSSDSGVPSLNPLLLDWLLTCDLRRIRNLDELQTAMAVRIAEIDRMLVLAVRQVIGSEKFQRLEASFRSINKLVQSGHAEFSNFRNMPESRRVNVFVLNVSADELESDLNANSHRQTWIYDKLFRKRFDYLIGEQSIELENFSAIHPFSLMIVDFDFGLHRPRSPHQQIGLDALRKLSKIGEDCFCMFLLNLAPNFFGESIQSFKQLENVIDVKAIFRQTSYTTWNEFRGQESARMIGLAMPRVLVRQPYKNYRMGNVFIDGTMVRGTGISFDEHDGFADAESLLWGRACFAVAQPIVHSFRQYDWFSDVSGVDRDPRSLPTEGEDVEVGYDGGLIRDLPKTCFSTDVEGVACYPPAEIVISETDEAAYSTLGLIPLFSIHQSSYLAMLSCQSVQWVRQMSTSDATANLRLSSMFNYMLCVCRMAHRLKIECRSLIGKSASPEDVQAHMQLWLMQHASGQNRGFEQKMIKPFFDEETRFEVDEDITDPGKYDCMIRLCPHHKYDSGRTRVVFEPVTMQMELSANDEGN